MDKALLKTAVEHLIREPKYIEQKKYVLETISNWDKRQIRFVGDDECLNALVDLGVESSEALQNVFALIERKRRAIPTVKKVDYQRDYMRQRRARIAMAIKLEQIVSGEKMDADTRTAFGAAMMADWTTQRELMLAEHPNADWKERNALVGEFWEKIDRRLENELAKANSVLSAPDHRKVRKVQVRKPVGIIGEKLTAALQNRKR